MADENTPLPAGLAPTFPATGIAEMDDTSAAVARIHDPVADFSSAAWLPPVEAATTYDVGRHGQLPNYPVQPPELGLHSDPDPFMTPLQEANAKAIEDAQKFVSKGYLAFRAGFKDTFLQRLFIDPGERPDFSQAAGPAPTAEQMSARILQAPFSLDEAQQRTLARSKSWDEFNYYIERFKKRGDLMRHAAAHPVPFMLGSMADIDILAAAFTGGSSALLKGGSAVLRGGAAIEEAGAAARALNTGARGLERLGEISQFAVTESRLANAGIAGATGLGLGLAADVTGDTETTMREKAQFALVFSAAGVLAKARPDGLLTHADDLGEVPKNGYVEPEVPTPPALEPEVRNPLPTKAQEAKVVNPPTLDPLVTKRRLEAADVAGKTPKQIAKLQVEREAYSINRYRDSAEAFQGENILDHFPGIKQALPDLNLGSFDELVAHVKEQAGEFGAAVGGKFDGIKLSSVNGALAAVRQAQSQFAKGSKILVLPEKEGNLGMMWALDKDVAVLQLGKEAFKDAAQLANVVSHEMGHFVVKRELQTNTKVRKALAAVYEEELGRSGKTSAEGIADATNIVGRDAAELGQNLSTNKLGMGSSKDSLKYWRSFSEFSAQQFVRYIQDVLHEAATGTEDIAKAAKATAAFQSIPAALREPTMKLLEMFRNTYNAIFQSGKLKSAPAFRKWFEQIGERQGLLEPNPMNAVPTVVTPHPGPEGLDVPKVSPSEEILTGDAAIQTLTTGPAGGFQPPMVARPDNYANQPALLRWMEQRYGMGWFSLYDKAVSYGGAVHANMQNWVMNGAGNSAESSAAFARSAHLDLNARLMRFEDAITEHIGMPKYKQILNRSAFSAQYNTVLRQVQDILHQKHSAHLNGTQIPTHSDPAIEALAQVYVDSGFAEKALDYLQTAERTGANMVEHSPYYIPMKTSWDSIQAGVNAGKFTRADVRELLVKQARAIIPGAPAEVQERMADGILDGIRQRAQGNSADLRRFEGLTVDELEQALVHAGLPRVDIDGLLYRASQATEQRSADTMLKGRLDWDFTIQHQGENGNVITMSDIIETNLAHSLELYARATAGAHGLGMMGYRNMSDVTRSINLAIEEMAQRGLPEADRRAARTMMENTIDSLMGRQVGEQVPQLLRAMSSISSSVLLKNSALYNFVEVANLVHNTSVIRVAKAFTKSEMFFNLKRMTDADDLSGLQKIMENKYLAEGRWKSLLTHTEDNFALPETFTAGLTAFGETGRFWNGMEFVRRKVAAMAVQLGVDDLHGAVRGSQEAIDRLRAFGLTDELLNDVRAEMAAHGDHPARWNPEVQIRAENMVGNFVDQLNQQQRLGEIPAFMQFSPMARVILPFMNFVGGATNKVLRRTLNDQGAIGAAQLMFWQVQAACLAEAARNLSAGRQPTDSGQAQYFQRVLTVASMSGWFGPMADVLTGNAQNSVASLAILQQITRAAKDPSLAHIVGATPGIAVIPGAQALAKMAE